MRTSAEVIEAFSPGAFDCPLGDAAIEVLDGCATLVHPDGSIDYLIPGRSAATRPGSRWFVTERVRLAVTRD